MTEHDTSCKDANRLDETKPRWCVNRPDWKPGYWAPDRIYAADGTWQATQAWVTDAGSSRCMWAVTGSAKDDTRCAACERRDK